MSRNTTRPGKDFWLAALRHDGALIDAVATPDALPQRVPGRASLTVHGLLGTLGAEYRWVCEHLRRGVPTRPEHPLPDPPAVTDLIDWWRASYRMLLTTLDAVDADLPAWNWAPQPKRAAFWHRRMAHLTALDRWDIQVSLGTPEPLEAKAAADGVTELFDTVLAAKLGARRHEPAGTVRLVAADTGHEWLVRLRPQGFALLDAASSNIRPSVHAVAGGTASDLLLALTGRIGFDILDTAGDTRLLARLVPET